MRTDYLLFQFKTESQAEPLLASTFQQFCANQPLILSVHRMAYSVDQQLNYYYAKLGTPTSVDFLMLSALQMAFRIACGHDARVSRLALAFQGATNLVHQSSQSTQIAQFHYVVETDVEASWWPEIVRWYDTEHMPGLAAVPGCLHAMRLLNHDHCHEANDNRPLSFACYDLTSPAVVKSVPWLAVRHTAWSDVARSHFTNTVRTMFGVVQ